MPILEHASVAANGAKLRVVRAGKGKPPLLLPTLQISSGFNGRIGW